MPNAGFLEDVVVEDPAFSSSVQASSSCEASSDASIDPQSDDANKKEVAESAETEDAVSEHHPSSMTQLANDPAEEVTTEMANVKVSDNVAGDEPIVEEQLSLSTEDVDVYLDKCLLQALHTTVKDKDLPMPGSTLWYIFKDTLFIQWQIMFHFARNVFLVGYITC